MRPNTPSKTQVPFPFVLEELTPLRLTIKKVFGFTYFYFDELLLFSLRDNIRQPGTNGMWLFTSEEHLESLAREFPQLPRRQFWRSGKNCWVVIASRLEYFEEYAFKACVLFLNRDPRIGRITRRKSQLRPANVNLWNERTQPGVNSVGSNLPSSRREK
jgi:hypothetical protein